MATYVDRLTIDVEKVLADASSHSLAVLTSTTPLGIEFKFVGDPARGWVTMRDIGQKEPLVEYIADPDEPVATPVINQQAVESKLKELLPRMTAHELLDAVGVDQVRSMYGQKWLLVESVEQVSPFMIQINTRLGNKPRFSIHTNFLYRMSA